MDQTLASLFPTLKDIIGKDIKYPLSAEEKEKIRDYDKKHPIFSNLPKMPGTDELVKFIEHNFSTYYLLTLDDKLVPDQAKQKQEWADKHLRDFRFIAVTGKGTNKAKYANPNCVLIDDAIDNIHAWEKAGGIGIHYVSADKTISALKSILK